jgi:hypothetical protein
MSSTLILMIVFVIVVALGAAAWYLFRGRSLRRRFGPEYDRLVDDNGRAEAERELRERMRRYADLDLHELTPDQRERYIGRWRALQIHFVDQPHEAVREADNLTADLIADIGYPAEDRDEQLAQLSIDHAGPLPEYREARDLSTRLGGENNGEVSTEQLRRAMVQYRAMIADLIGGSSSFEDDERKAGHAS